ncbi:DUF2079 domain-containing protein [Halobacteriovorax sp. GB3]|uniref:DUF2079 domain-containing protein n=1 Tax=Halobacteriovorax sp. GB3 TaxID=2719615 RepID=UPI00235E9CC1|nr:DUF2079 domain-containing protein [Halobacteriovorax sp. GB3]MDD0852548.1 DUF2079 domain-containing protein [Halobacteriovorax sp. GB3]
MKFYQYFVNALLTVILTIIVLGGYYLKTDSFKLDLSNVDVWGLVLLLTIGIGYRFREKFEMDPLKKLHQLYEGLKSERLFTPVFLFFSIATIIGHIFKQYSFNSHGLDQSFIHQPIFYPFFNNKVLFCDLCPNNTFFGEHINFTFLLISPIASILKSDIFLFIVNVVLLYGGLFLLLLFGPIRKYRKYWTIFLLLILTSRTLRNGGIWDLREDHFAFFFIILSFLSLYHKKVWLYFITLLAVLLSKENMPYLVPFFAIPIFLEKEFKYSKSHKIILSVFTVLIGGLTLYLNSKYISPFFNDGVAPTPHMTARFDGIANTTSELIYKMLFDPSAQWKLLTERILTGGAVKYLLILVLPFTLILKKRFFWLFAAAPVVAMNLLSYASTQRMMIFHYDLTIVAILSVALVFSFHDLLTNEEKSNKSLKIALLLAICVSGRWPSSFIWKYFPTFETISDVNFIKSIQTKETLGTSMKLMGYTTHLPSQTVLYFDETNYPRFWDKNKNRTELGSFKKDLSYILIDKRVKNQALILDQLKTNNWKEVDRSNTNNLILLHQKL